LNPNPNPKTLKNAANIPLNVKNGTIPQMDEALHNWLQPMTFIQVSKYQSGGMNIESAIATQPWTAPDGTTIQGVTVNFQGIWIPRTRQLVMKKEGQRRWSNVDVIAQTQLPLKNDDCVIYPVTNTQYRVMDAFPMALYGFYKYYLMEDFVGAGPYEVTM